MERLHNEDTDSLYRSPNTVKVINCWRLRLAGHVARIKESRSVLYVLTRKPYENIPSGRSLRTDLKEIVLNKKNWVDSAHERNYWSAFANAELNLRVP